VVDLRACGAYGRAVRQILAVHFLHVGCEHLTRDFHMAGIHAIALVVSP